MKKVRCIRCKNLFLDDAGAVRCNVDNVRRVKFASCNLPVGKYEEFVFKKGSRNLRKERGDKRMKEQKSVEDFGKNLKLPFPEKILPQVDKTKPIAPPPITVNRKGRSNFTPHAKPKPETLHSIFKSKLPIDIIPDELVEVLPASDDIKEPVETTHKKKRRGRKKKALDKE